MTQLFRYLWRKQFGFKVDLNQLALEPFDGLEKQFEDVYNQLKDIFADNADILSYLDKIQVDGKLLFRVAPAYDYRPDTPGNGFWTYLKLLTKFGLYIKLYRETEGVHISEDLKAKALDICKLVESGLNVCHKIVRKEPMNETPDHSLILGVDLFDNDNLLTSKLNLIELLELLRELKPQQATLYSMGNFLWISPSISNLLQLVTAFMAVYSTQWRSPKLYNFFSRENRGRMFANMGQNINIDCLKRMWNFSEYRMIRMFFSYSANVTTENIYVPKQHRWTIDRDEPKVHDNNVVAANETTGKGKQVRCLLFKSSQRNNNHQSILFYIHGGGFISQTPETHESYLRDWATQLKDIPILCIDYTLSPEGPFPVALQEVLDCYLWLTSGDISVQHSIGFQPRKVALAGDSAGGNLSMSLLLVLRNIERQLKRAKDPRQGGINFPVGIFCYYTPFILTAIVSPSRLICSIDGLIPVGVLLCCLEAYVPTEVLDKGIENDHSLVDQDTSCWNHMLNKVSSLGAATRTKPWYSDEVLAKPMLRNLNKFTTNPFVSPLLASKGDLDDIDIPLYLYPVTYDSFLDDSIEMAKLWKGKVYLEVIDGLPHGFLNFVKFSAQAKEASDRCLLHIHDVLG